MLGPDDKSAMFLRNVGRYPPNDEESHRQKTESSATPLENTKSGEEIRLLHFKPTTV
jgi:hypothetical protein